MQLNQTPKTTGCDGYGSRNLRGTKPETTVEYKTLVPGVQHFNCQTLRAMLSAAACGNRWLQATAGSSCQSCELGRHHAQLHQPAAVSASKRGQGKPNSCVRCERSDLRIIPLHGLCISCANRTAEVRKGKNGRGTAPVKLRLHDVEVGFQHKDGHIEYRTYCISMDHPKEAYRRALRQLPEGANILSIKPNLSAPKTQNGAFAAVS